MFVIAGHFFSLNTALGSTPYYGELSLFIQGWASFLFKGVPLFLMLTGYLNVNKTEYSWNYVKRMKKVILPYLFFSVVTILFRKLYLEEDISWMDLGLKILDFSAIPYAWYIEMWIGLYLLTPLLNRGFDAFATSNPQMNWIIVVLYFLTAVPSFTNRYGLYVMPEFWKGFYPVLYFFIGRYIREYRFTMKVLHFIVIALVICSINPTLSALLASGHTMLHIAGGSTDMFGVILFASLFMVLLKVKDIRPRWMKVVITRISVVSLDMYLCCYISDRLIYPLFQEHFFENQCQYGKWFFVIVPCLVIVSYLMAEAKGLLLDAGGKLVNRMSSYGKIIQKQLADCR